MDKNFLNLVKYREGMYRLLSSLYIEELNKDSLGRLLNIGLPRIGKPVENWQLEFNAGYDLFAGYLDSCRGLSEEELTQKLEYLAADYAKTFLAAGEATGKAAFPYESVYVGHDNEFGGSIQETLHALYSVKGLETRKDIFKINDDHIGLIFNYMAELLAVHADALTKDDENLCKTVVFDQVTFFNDHIIKWANLFTSDAFKYADTDFYKGLARMTTGYLGFEQEVVKMKKIF